jgi:glutamate-1-semialdehyde 2,1-aminomutase
MHKTNAALFQAAKKVIPGGVNSPVRAFGSVNLDPPFIHAAKGARITDAEGKTYTDFVGSWGPMIVGHAHKEVLAALQETMARGTSFGAPTALEIQMAEKIISLMPSVDMVRMVNSGTEATMSAIRLARGVTGRDKIIKFEGCYHGHGDSFLIKAGSGALTLGQPTSPGVPLDFARHTLNATFNDLTSIDELFASFPQEIAAVIVEPIAGNMGVIPPQVGFLEGLRERCTKEGALLIFDEVMTGFRVHPGGAQSLYGVTPDLTTMGKVIGGGLPAAAYGGKADYMSMIAPLGPVYQAGTLSGNPLAMAAGLATLDLIAQPGFFDALNAKSDQFFSGMRAYIERQGYPLQLNYVNSMGCLFFSKNPVVDYASATTSDTQTFARFFAICLEHGVYLAPSQFEAMFLSSAHSDAILEETSSIMAMALDRVFS